MECGILRARVYGFLQSANGGAIRALIIVGPAERIGCIWKIGEAAPSCLSEGKSDIDVSPVFQHQVGKIIGSDGIVGLYRQRFLILVLGLLPIAATFEKRSQKDVKASVLRILLNGALVI